MLVGDRFEKNGKLYEVTRVIDENNYGFREVTAEPVFEPVFKPTFEEEVKEVKVKRGRKKV